MSTIRTFHPRRGRMGLRRREQLRELEPVYGLPATGDRLDPASLYGRRAPLVLEIGSGMGDATATMAAAHPDHDYLAAEVHSPGVAHLLELIDTYRLSNLRVVHGDAIELLRHRLAPDSLAAIHAFFPDPWPKQRHHKRRLFQPGQVALLRSRLVPGGTLWTATDWADYARVIRTNLTADPELINPYGGWAPGRAGRPLTKYEQRALDAGRPVFELVFHRA
jgi:tRNA (guanine-N7-)-methyltransferase